MMARIKKRVEEKTQGKIRADFLLKGHSLEELLKLSFKELSQLVPARARRTILRGFTPTQLVLFNKIKNREEVLTRSRDTIILPLMVGKTIGIYNGKSYKKVLILPEMIGRYLGQFSLTRTLVRYQKKSKEPTKPKKK